MMAVGAVGGFAAGAATGSPWLGVAAAVLAGMLTAVPFAVLTQTLLTNQVATGLALTLFGLGLSGLLGEPFTGAPGRKLELGQEVIVSASFALAAGAAWFFSRTRAGLVVQAVGGNHDSAHALGYSVVRIRYACILFGGACAGLAGGYLSLVYTPQWVESMTAGRGWIALALVVFGTWNPLRVLFGAYAFGAVWILGLHAQGFGLGIAPQLLSALPYAMTILVLVFLSGRARSPARGIPACLGLPFVTSQ